MSQQNNQNEPNKTPAHGMLHKMKVSLFVNRLTNWYFSKNALPYWCILALDSLAILFAGIVENVNIFAYRFFRLNSLW